MKTFSAALGAALLFLATSVGAQEALERTLPQPSNAVELPLIPEEVPPTSRPRGRALDQPQDRTPKRSSTEASLEELKDRIRFREAKTKALRDPQVQAEWDRSVRAATEYEKREALKNYYRLLFARMSKLDRSLKKLIDERQLLALRRLEQTRIDPTQPFAGVE